MLNAKRSRSGRIANHYFLDPFGCAKNQVDAESMMAALNEAGWQTSECAEADYIIINSCAFIESAKRESINAVLNYHRQYPYKKIVLAGCLAQRYKHELEKILPEATILFGTGNPEQIVTALGAGAPSHIDKGNRPLLSSLGSAYVKITEGCNNHCSFCAIPLIRGKLCSRPIDDIVSECQTLLERGIYELCLVGQDTASFGMDRGKQELPILLEKIATLPHKFWLRLLYLHPDHIPDSLFLYYREEPRFLPYFDIPLQHASGTMLDSMNRHGTSTSYIQLIEKIRTQVPNAVIRSTFLVGFPGETERDFRTLLRFQKTVSLDWLGCFCYSREEGTPAYCLSHHVPKQLALKRKQMLEEKQVAITVSHLDQLIGTTVAVLIEREIDKGIYIGRTYGQAPEVDGFTIVHSIVPLACGSVSHGIVQSREKYNLHVYSNGGK
ncbi:MAG: 30S ribosomal protein S12 methylthiotransferase RimO [Treponema sp.]|nr:30S ribosomal protein S12 methylthiotransferase RimO [Treponema sp.]